MSMMHLPHITLKSVPKVAYISRLIVFSIQYLALQFIPIHENDGFRFQREKDYGTFMDKFVHEIFRGFASWDGQYFLHIANYGYTHDNTIAFFPLFPVLVRLVSSIVHMLTFPIMAFSSTVIVVGLCLNLYFFVKSAEILYRLTPHLDGKLENLSTMVVFLFCYNPASIFFSAFYSESLFAYLTFRLLLCLHEGKSTQAVLLASLSATCRSNGMLNFGFVIGFSIYHVFRNRPQFELRFVDIRKLMGTACQCLIGFIPFLSFQLFSYLKICSKEFVFPEKVPEMCVTRGVQLPYSYIQSTNWNVGLFKYFEVKQLPNFLLAVPILSTLLVECYLRLSTYMKNMSVEKTFKRMPISVICSCHGIFLSIFCFLCIHVQVSTRLILSSCPYLYIFIAKSIRNDIFSFRHRQKTMIYYSLSIYSWCLIYFLIGSMAFSTGYPWT